MLIFTLASTAIASDIEADRDHYAWVLQAFGIQSVQIGQHRDDIARALPDLYFAEPKRGEKAKPYEIAVLLDHDHLNDPEQRTHWSLSLWFDKETGRLFHLRASLPPLASATDQDTIERVLRRLGLPTSTEVEDSRWNPDAEISVATWGNLKLPSKHPRGQAIRLHLGRDKINGDAFILEINEYDFGLYNGERAVEPR